MIKLRKMPWRPQFVICRARYIFIALFAVLASVDALARTCNDASILRSDQPRTATVANDADPRLHFQRSSATCPGGKDCNTKAYLLPDDNVLISDDGDSWVCAYFKGPKRDTVGWLPRSALAIDTTPSLPAKHDWVGRWRRGRNLILVDERQGRRLYIQGWAFGAAEFAITDFETDTVPEGNQIAYKDGKCRITLRWVGGFLLVTNTQDCVDVDITFDGIYRRTALTIDPKDER